jgi:hypothetical protein
LWYIFREADVRLVLATPVRRRPSQSGASSTQRALSHSAGSSSFIHIALKTNHSAEASSPPPPL